MGFHLRLIFSFYVETIKDMSSVIFTDMIIYVSISMHDWWIKIIPELKEEIFVVQIIFLKIYIVQ